VKIELSLINSVTGSGGVRSGQFSLGRKMAGLGTAKSDAQKYKLFCPLCSQRMEPLIVDSTGEGQIQEETIWWTCQGVRTKSCDFPLSMPSEVFWTTRNSQQIESDVVPLPNFHLLPTKFHHLYSAFYNPTQSSQSSTSSASPRVMKRNAVPSCFPHRPSKVIKSAITPRVKQKDVRISDEKCLELVDSHVPYLLKAETISARVGKEYQTPQKAAESNSIEWTDMDLSNGKNASNENNERNSVNLPSCSSASSNSLENNLSLLPEDHPLHLQSLGDTELDSLVLNNLSGILRSKKLRKRKKKPKIKPIEEEQVAPPAFENEFIPYAPPEQPDEFGFDVGIIPWF